MLNEFGIKSFDSRSSLGRFSNYDDDLVFCEGLDPFFVDSSIKLLNSKAFRRKSFQTQVFDQPYNKHIRTRASHTYEVNSFCRLTSELLKLNTPLCCAESLGHDLGHFPFGHTTEEVITKRVRDETGCSKLKIDHVLMGLIVSALVERRCDGLNLSYETMEGMLYHSTGGGAFSIDSMLPQEYSVLRYMDKVAYLFGDINDAERLGLLSNSLEEFKPVYDNLKIISEYYPFIGKNFSKNNQRARSYTCINELVNESREKGCVSFSKGPVFEAFDDIRRLMYELVYDRIDWSLHNLMVGKVYDVLSSCTLKDYEKYCSGNISSFISKRNGKGLIVSDSLHLPHPALIISLMTDYDINTLVDKFKLRRKLELKDVLFETPLHEMIPYILLKDIPIVQLSNDWGEYGKSNPQKFLRNFLKDNFSDAFNLKR